MKRIVFFLALSAIGIMNSKAQGFDFKFQLNGCKDSMAFLLKYQFDQTYMVDTCKNIKKGLIQFKGKEALDKGVYILVSQEKVPFFEFIINESQKLSFNSNADNIIADLNAPGSKENELYFEYMKNGVAKNKEFNQTRESLKGKSQADSTRLINEKIAQLNEDVKTYDANYMQKVKGTFVYDIYNLKTEKFATDVPKAKNGRPDSVYQYYYYKSHYFDGVDFKDERIVRTPYFDERVKKYFDNVVPIHPDTVIQEMDKILAKCTEGNLVYKILLGYFTYKYEVSKIISFDKVFVHLADNYIINGKAYGIYNAETIKIIKDRTDIMRNLLIGKKVSDMFLIDTIDGGRVRKMGFDTVTSAESITKLYYKNQDKLAPMFKTLYAVNAKYTVLVFWAADCGHCQTEIPKLHEDMKVLVGKVDVKVLAVQTKDDLFESWKKFIVEHKLTNFSHVFDPVHIVDIKNKFDVNSTPVIYILDRDKKVIAKKLGAGQVVDMIKNLEVNDKKP
jgi:thiol-disulfide isomerase/thioredoxin